MKFIFLITLLFVALSSHSSNAIASNSAHVRRGNQLFKEGKFDESIAHYEKASGVKNGAGIVDYDLGAAYYKKGEFAKAMDYWQKSSLIKDKLITSQSQYNLGNALYKSGLARENTDLDGALADLEQAITSYDLVLATNPKEEDAVFNKQSAQAQLERLRKKKQEQQQQDNKESQEKKENQQQQEQDKNEQDQNKEEKTKEEKAKEDKAKEDQAKEDQKSKDKSKAVRAKENSDKDQKDKESSEQETAEEQLDPKEQQAKDMLEDYERNEQPKKLLHFIPKSSNENPVIKDW